MPQLKLQERGTEVKSLADQSKEATEQIGAILSDTRKWVSAVVMATEQGTKAVESGVEQSRVTGEAINSLFDSVATSVQAATVISASSNEQLAGTEQASKAMVSIEQTMRENLHGTSQVEESSKKLEELGESLDLLVKYYKV
jgi:methyl-accepting chemotaxis protein